MSKHWVDYGALRWWWHYHIVLRDPHRRAVRKTARNRHRADPTWPPRRAVD